MADLYTDLQLPRIIQYQDASPHQKWASALLYWEEFRRITWKFSKGTEMDMQRAAFLKIFDDAVALDLQMCRGTMARMKFSYPNKLVGTKFKTMEQLLAEEETVETAINQDIKIIIAPALYRQGNSVGEAYDQEDVQIMQPTVSCAKPVRPTNFEKNLAPTKAILRTSRMALKRFEQLAVHQTHPRPLENASRDTKESFPSEPRAIIPQPVTKAPQETPRDPFLQSRNSPSQVQTTPKRRVRISVSQSPDVLRTHQIGRPRTANILPRDPKKGPRGSPRRNTSSAMEAAWVARNNEIQTKPAPHPQGAAQIAEDGPCRCLLVYFASALFIYYYWFFR